MDVLSQINDVNRYSFDQRCRVTAIERAARLGMDSLLSINFLPNAVYQPAACLEKTFEAAARARFPLHHLMFEVTENEPSRDVEHLQSIFKEYNGCAPVPGLSFAKPAIEALPSVPVAVLDALNVAQESALLQAIPEPETASQMRISL